MMQPSIFNTRVPLSGGNEVFLMNTFTDAQLVVSAEAAALLDRLEAASETEREKMSLDQSDFSDDERVALQELAKHGFIVDNRQSERVALEKFFSDFHHNTDEMHVTVLTTLQCNFACDYCLQGDHGDYNLHANKMSLETAGNVCDWLTQRLDTVKPRKLALTFFGGEPLLNLPVLYEIAERAWTEAQLRNIEMQIQVITNGLLLTPEVVDRLKPFGLNGFKVTLDGDRETHDRMRPLRGGQATFDRIIENIRQVADKCNIAIGGNFDEESIDSYPALLDFLRGQEFADSLVKVAFKPIISMSPSATPPTTDGVIPLTAVDPSGKPLGGGCMTSAGAGGGSPCDSCHFLDEKMSTLMEETKRRGFHTIDGVHMGPCEIHMKHAHTIGTDGSLYACPGFATETHESVGHIDGRQDNLRNQAEARFDAIGAWRSCGDCSFIPVCAGGCSVASHNELGDMNAPTCHKNSFESALVSLAHEAAGLPTPRIGERGNS